MRVHLSQGQCSDFTGADMLLMDLPGVRALIGDKGYDSNKVHAMAVEQGIPPKWNSIQPVHYSKRLCKMLYNPGFG